MKKHKSTDKKQELLDRLATMHKEDVISKKEYVSIKLYGKIWLIFV
jgi:hypothetical protein